MASKIMKYCIVVTKTEKLQKCPITHFKAKFLEILLKEAGPQVVTPCPSLKIADRGIIWQFLLVFVILGSTWTFGPLDPRKRRDRWSLGAYGYKKGWGLSQKVLQTGLTNMLPQTSLLDVKMKPKSLFSASAHYYWLTCSLLLQARQTWRPGQCACQTWFL